MRIRWRLRLVDHALAEETAEPDIVGPDVVPIILWINGTLRELPVAPQMTLSETSRGPLGLTGNKIACNRGACSACTVWLDGFPAGSCMMPAIDFGEQPVTKIEGLADGDTLQSVQATFIEHDAKPCGFCTLFQPDGRKRTYQREGDVQCDLVCDSSSGAERTRP